MSEYGKQTYWFKYKEKNLANNRRLKRNLGNETLTSGKQLKSQQSS